MEQDIKTAKIQILDLEANAELLSSAAREKDAVICEYEATVQKQESESGSKEC